MCTTIWHVCAVHRNFCGIAQPRLGQLSKWIVRSIHSDTVLREQYLGAYPRCLLPRLVLLPEATFYLALVVGQRFGERCVLLLEVLWNATC